MYICICTTALQFTDVCVTQKITISRSALPPHTSKHSASVSLHGVSSVVRAELRLSALHPWAHSLWSPRQQARFPAVTNRWSPLVGGRGAPCSIPMATSSVVSENWQCFCYIYIYIYMYINIYLCNTQLTPILSHTHKHTHTHLILHFTHFIQPTKEMSQFVVFCFFSRLPFTKLFPHLLAFCFLLDLRKEDRLWTVW